MLHDFRFLITLEVRKKVYICPFRIDRLFNFKVSRGDN